MRCVRAKKAVIERDLDLLDARSGALLDVHLRGCADCRTSVGLDALVVHELAALRHAPPIEAHVADRVRHQVARLGRVDRTEVPRRQLGWAASAVGLGVTGLALLLLGWARGVGNPFAGLGALGRTALALLASLGRVLQALAGAALEVGGALVQSLGAFQGTAELLRPAMWVVLAVSYLLMGLIITTVLGRDLLRGRPMPVRRRRS